MKNKAPLALIEQVIMLLVLSVAAALCLQAFLWADRQADMNSRRDLALQQMQSTAEVLKAERGDLDTAAQTLGGSVEDGLWNRTCGDLLIRVIPLDSGNALLGKASITAEYDGEPLGELTVCYQEVSP